MPGMSGLEVIQEIRAQDADVPIIVVTGYPSTESAVRALRYHVYDYLVKPLDEDDLMAKIEKYLK